MPDPTIEAVLAPGPDPAIQALTPPAAAETWPLAFDGHAGWLHAALDGPAGEVGVVICSPLGRDARCAHAPLRQLAERLAQAGVPTLRYDPLGTGDSLDLPDPAADALPVWREGLAAAVAALRRHVQVKRVVMVGLRFGATLAALSGDLADGLVLLAPIVRGGPWLRELRLATAMLAPTTGGVGGGEAGLDADGLVLSAATVAALGRIDLRGQDFARRPVLLIAQNPNVTAFGQASALAGARVVIEAFPGFETLFEDSHSNQPPETVFARTVDWIRAGFWRETAGRAAITPPTADQARLFPPAAVEDPVRFGGDLRGVLCGPADPRCRRADLAVIFCNTGGDPRAGIGGFSTHAARALAAQGVLSLRFDFAGLGDSPPRPGRTHHIYETPRRDDFDAALALLAAHGVGRAVVAGVCAGGYHALRAGMDDPRVAGVCAINTVVLAWREGTSLAIRDRDQGRSTQAYLQRLRQWDTWKRLVLGGLDVAAVAQTFQRRAKAWQAARSAAAPENLIKTRLSAMSARGGRLRLVVGQDDPALDMIATHFGVGGRQLTAQPGLSLRVLPGLDHGLAQQRSRDLAQTELLAFVDEF